MQEVEMKKLVLPFIVTACTLSFLVVGCGDKNTLEACLYETTMNLDKGNYDAVLQSACATPMHLGAAYFGKAGYSVTSVVNALISSQATSGQTALQQYMTSMTGKITDSTIEFLDSSMTIFGDITPTSIYYHDARFNLSIVAAVKAESLLKTVIDSAGLGTLSTCDINGNGKPDEADALTCSLLVSGTTLTGGACPAPLASAATYTITPTDITFSSATGTYRGLTVTMSGSSTPSCSQDYDKLLYFKSGDGTYHTATTSGTCQASDGKEWPCPVTSNLDLVAALEDSVNSSIDALSTAITGTTATDVQQAIWDIQAQACGGDSVCTSADLAAYIQNNL
jgi:hypothetical protein